MGESSAPQKAATTHCRSGSCPSSGGAEGTAVGGRRGRGARRKCSRSEAAVPKPACQATSSTGSSVSSSRRRASVHAPGEQPLQRRRAGLLAEAAGEGAGADAGVAGHRGDVERLGEALGRPAAGCSRNDPAGGCSRRPLDELRLAAVAVGRGDHVAGGAVADGCAAVGADDVQAEVDAGAEAGGGHHRRPRRRRARPRRPRPLGKRRQLRRGGPVGRGPRPSSRPAWARAKAPVQTESTRAPRWAAARRASSGLGRGRALEEREVAGDDDCVGARAHRGLEP